MKGTEQTVSAEKNVNIRLGELRKIKKWGSCDNISTSKNFNNLLV
jgi:hypothetical protein